MGAPQSLSSDLREAGLPAHAVDEWLAAEPRACGEFGEDRRLYAAFWALADALIARQPKKPRRNAAGAKAAAAIRERARRSRERFLDAHVEKVYAALTHDFSRFIRVEEIVHAAAEAFPGLTPARAAMRPVSTAPSAVIASVSGPGVLTVSPPSNGHR